MMNQLVSVDDKLNGKVYNYTYDAGGVTEIEVSDERLLSEIPAQR